jgi:hypothetical protein
MLVATVTDIVVGGVIAAAAGLFATIVQWVLMERSRKATERQARLDRAASTVGRTLSLLRDIDPKLFIGILSAEKVREVILNELWPRWEPLQDELEVIAAAHTDKAIRTKTDETIATILKVFSDVRFHADLRSEEPLTPEQWASVDAVHADAIAKTKGLLAAVRAA